MSLDGLSSQLLPGRSAKAYRCGNVLGSKYRLERLLGQGGIASVWLAHNLVLDIPVAIKIVRPENRCPEAAARLLREARVQARLEHPHVVRVFDCGETEPGDPYIVMELLEGLSLAALLAQSKQLPALRAVRLLMPILDALSVAHRLGIVHRDLKPENIFLAQCEAGRCPKILDFGIAKMRQQAGARRWTLRGSILGSPAYMSPEQARGLLDVDSRADVWAMCVILYEAVSGKLPFSGANHNALLCSVIDDEVAPLAQPGSAGLWPILARGLEKDRDRRWSSIDVLAHALSAWLQQQDVAAEAALSANHAQVLVPPLRVSAPAAKRIRAPSPRRPVDARARAAQLAQLHAVTAGALAISLALAGLRFVSDMRAHPNDALPGRQPAAAPAARERAPKSKLMDSGQQIVADIGSPATSLTQGRGAPGRPAPLADQLPKSQPSPAW